MLLLLSLAVVGWETLWRYVTEILVAQTAAVPCAENQSYNGLISRLVVPASQTTWLTSLPFPTWAGMAFELVALVTLAVTIGVLWIRPHPTQRTGTRATPAQGPA